MNTSKTIRIAGFQSGHDVAYCILENGIPILCEELERITRTKMELGDGLKFFFSRNKSPYNINHFTFGNYGGRGGKRQKITADKESENKMYNILAKSGGKFWEFGHHQSHAANAFYTSNFNKSLIITVDGGGSESDGKTTGLVIHEGNGTKITRVHLYPFGPSLGEVWHEMTNKVFGLSVGYPKGDQAGTVMAMATLGEPKYVDLISNHRTNLKKLRLLVSTSEQKKFNVAASLQEYTEQTLKKMVSGYIGNHENLCLSGGVSLNCVLVGKIRTWFPQIKNIFCDPVPYDAGLAIGSARYLWHAVLGNPRIKGNSQNISPYLGKSYSKQEVTSACNLFASKIEVKKVTERDVLDKIERLKIISVYGGHSETGRRALGNRSILADPRNLAIKAEINNRIKHRQWFRPLAPAILEEKVADWFEDPIASPYMSITLKFKMSMKDKVPAVVHYDGTGRLQTVSKSLNPWFHGFLTKWESLTGIPILINTSFNDSEPIVETPIDAITCFLKTNIDYLYFFDYSILVKKI